MAKPKPLKRYSKIVKDEAQAGFLKPDIDWKIKKTKQIMKSCRLCERRCGTNRFKEKGKFCRLGDRPSISSEFLHYGEESFFVPSHTIFFMGCTFSCQYCQNWTISHWYEQGRYIEPKDLAEIIKRRKEEGSINLNFVGGEPTPNLLYILEVLKELQKMKVNIPVLWNSNMYMSEETMKILDGVVDVYLSDFKYGNSKCALRLSKIPDYFEPVSRNHKTAAEQAEICIRQLVLPNHVGCCSLPVLEWISGNFGKKVVVNIMSQYKPEFKAYKYDDINRMLTVEEYEKVLDKAKELGLFFM